MEQKDELNIEKALQQTHMTTKHTTKRRAEEYTDDRIVRYVINKNRLGYGERK